jgi:hypothetical protein
VAQRHRSRRRAPAALRRRAFGARPAHRLRFVFPKQHRLAHTYIYIYDYIVGHIFMFLFVFVILIWFFNLLIIVKFHSIVEALPDPLIGNKAMKALLACHAHQVMKIRQVLSGLNYKKSAINFFLSPFAANFDHTNL